eukprot:COSAG05_NODE_1636_length_4365_cov_8.688467_1_plen_96_part_00
MAIKLHFVCDTSTRRHKLGIPTIYSSTTCISPLPLNQARNTTSFNQTSLTLANSTKMIHSTIPQVDSSAHQIPFIYIFLSSPHINTIHVVEVEPI